ncbi:MAG: ABC transporter permease [Oscillospiraceae bacterium]|nr:ABC transporter permease [Oscillospiraceae bacterium]MCI9526830.1 ABC transporter permease [Lachnospiraceae bacterium]
MKRLKNWIIGFIHYQNLLKELVIRDLKIKYRRSILGYLWSVLNPLMIMVVMTIVFSTMFRRNIEYFPVYLLSGQLMFNFMTNSTNQGMRSILGNALLIKKVYVPKYIFTLAKVTSCLVDLMLSLIALAIVMLFFRVPLSPYLLLFPVVLFELYLFCAGLSIFLAQAAVFFRDVQYIYSVLTMAWMYLTPIFYPADMLEPRLLSGIEKFNPMYCYITQFRDVVLYGVMPSANLFLYGFGVAAGVLSIGVWSFLRTQDRFILYI